MYESLFIKTLAFTIVFSVCPPKWKAKMRMVVSGPVEERVLMMEKSTSVQNGLELSWPHSSAALSRPPLKCLLSRAARWVDQNILFMKTFARQCSVSGSKLWHSWNDFRQFYFWYAMLQPDAKLKGKKTIIVSWVNTFLFIMAEMLLHLECNLQKHTLVLQLKMVIRVNTKPLCIQGEATKVFFCSKGSQTFPKEAFSQHWEKRDQGPNFGLIPDIQRVAERRVQRVSHHCGTPLVTTLSQSSETEDAP